MSAIQELLGNIKKIERKASPLPETQVIKTSSYVQLPDTKRVASPHPIDPDPDVRMEIESRRDAYDEDFDDSKLPRVEFNEQSCKIRNRFKAAKYFEVRLQ